MRLFKRTEVRDGVHIEDVVLVVYFAAALVGSLLSVEALRAFALSRGFVAQPKADRWHRRPTALLGGVAIAATTLVGAVVLGIASDLFILWIGSALMFCVGLTDDLLPLKPSTKLVAEIAIGSLFVFYGYRLHWTDSLTLDAALTLLWFVGITNAFNLLDNMDGLAAGIGTIACFTTLAEILATNGSTAEAKYLAILIGAIAGFLVRNVHPAKIFMGDSGSLYIGVMLAALTTSPSRVHLTRLSLPAVIVPVMVLLIPIFDTTLVTWLRLLSGKRPSDGGRDHTSHRLVAMGLSERRAVAVLWTLAACGAVIGLWTALRPQPGISVSAAIFFLAMLVFAVYLSNVRVYENATASELMRLGKITPVVVDFLHKRRVAEVLFDFCLVSIAYYAAYGLRFEGDQYGVYFPVFLTSFPLIVGIQMVSFFVVGLYRGLWRHFGLMDAVVLMRGVFLGTLVSVGTIVYLYRFQNYSRGLFVVYAAVLLVLVGVSRASFRLMAEFVRRRHGGERLIIYGAGDSGTLILQHLLAHVDRRYKMIGFVDDDRHLHRARVRGYPVLGGFEALIQLIGAHRVDSVVIAAPDIQHEQQDALAKLCDQQGILLSRMSLSIQALNVVTDSLFHAASQNGTLQEDE